MSSADNPLRILFDEFKRSTNARFAAVSQTFVIISGGTFTTVDSYLTIEAGDYHLFTIIEVLADKNGDSAIFTQGNNGIPPDGVNTIQDLVGTLFKRQLQ